MVRIAHSTIPLQVTLKIGVEYTFKDYLRWIGLLLSILILLVLVLRSI